MYLRDVWPTREEIQAVERTFVIPSMFKEVYQKIEVPPPRRRGRGRRPGAGLTWLLCPRRR